VQYNISTYANCTDIVNLLRLPTVEGYGGLILLTYCANF